MILVFIDRLTSQPKADIQRRQIMNGEEYNVPSTIDDPVSLEDIEQLSQRNK